MQLANLMGYLKVGGIVALVGAAAALIVSYRTPRLYEASAMVRMTAVKTTDGPVSDEVLRDVGGYRAEAAALLFLGRDNLRRLVREFDLYPEEMKLVSLEDVVEQNRIHFSFQPQHGVARIAFAYPDPQKAQTVVNALVSQLEQKTDARNQFLASDWRESFAQPIPFREKVEVLSAPNLAPPAGRWPWPAAGAAAGLLLGLLGVLIRRHGKGSLRALACGVTAAACGFGLSLLFPEQYTVRTAMRVDVPVDPDHLSGAVVDPPASEWMKRLRNEILDDGNFRRKLWGLLGEDEARAALFNNRDQAFHIRMRDDRSFEITVSHPDPVKALAVVRDLISQFTLHARGSRDGHLNLLEQPILPTAPSTHYRLQFSIVGALLGILFAILRWSGPDHRDSNGVSLAGFASGSSSQAERPA